MSNFYIETERAEQKLAISTLTYLSCVELRREWPLQTILQTAKLAEYASGYWPDHAKAAMEIVSPHDVKGTEIYNLIKRLLLDPEYRGNYQSFLQVRAISEPLEQSHNMSHIITDFEPDLCPLYYPVLCGLSRTVERFIALHPAYPLTGILGKAGYVEEALGGWCGPWRRRQ